MVRPTTAVAAIVGFWSLGCIGVSGDPSGRFEIRQLTVTAANGDRATVSDAGAMQFHAIESCDSGWYLEDGPPFACDVDARFDAMSEVTYAWVGSGLVPVWNAEAKLFRLPDWLGEEQTWSGPIPVGEFSCRLVRSAKHPMVLEGKSCAGPEGGPFDVELVMDR